MAHGSGVVGAFSPCTMGWWVAGAQLGRGSGGVPCQGWTAHSPFHVPGLSLPPGESSAAAACTTTSMLVVLPLFFLLRLA